MKKIAAFTGMIIGSALGGWLGDMIGLWSTIILSAIGSGIGFYCGRKLWNDFLD